TVEPVVPVNRTRAYVPIHASGPSRRATLLARVRPCSRSPRLALASMSSSCVVPTRPTFLWRATPRTVAMSRSSRSPATPSGMAPGMRVAGVPSRGEYLKVKASSKPTSSTSERVAEKSVGEVVLAVSADVDRLANNRDIRPAARRAAHNLTHHILQLAAPSRATRPRNDAEAAPIIAAPLHRHDRRHGSPPHRWYVFV